MKVTNFTATDEQIQSCSFSLSSPSPQAEPLHGRHKTPSPHFLLLLKLSSIKHFFTFIKLVLQMGVFSVFSTAIKTSGSPGGNFSNRNYVIRTSGGCASISRSPSVNILSIYYTPGSSILGTQDSATNMRQSLPAIMALNMPRRERQRKTTSNCVCVFMCTCMYVYNFRN